MEGMLLDQLDDEYSFPYVLISADVKSLPFKSSQHIGAGRVVAVDVCTGENGSGEYRILWSLTYAATPEALERKDLKTIRFAFPERKAVPLATSILSASGSFTH